RTSFQSRLWVRRTWRKSSGTRSPSALRSGDGALGGASWWPRGIAAAARSAPEAVALAFASFELGSTVLGIALLARSLLAWSEFGGASANVWVVLSCRGWDRTRPPGGGGACIVVGRMASALPRNTSMTGVPWPISARRWK